MAHTGFAVFFLLALLVAAVALVRTGVQNLTRITRALHGLVVVREAADEVRLRVLPTAEVPRIAQRLAATFPDGLAPVHHVPRAWPFERTGFTGS
jgi:hypothetical protein